MLAILYSNDSSYYSMIARLVLAEKEVKYEMHKIDIHIKMQQFSPEYVTIQPNMTVPTLVYERNTIDDSHKILFFVNKNFAGQDLFPKEDMVAIQKSLTAHYSFSIEDLTMGNALRKSPIARFALGRGLSRASRRCRALMKAHPEFKVACEKKLSLEEQRRRLILSQKNNYAQVYQQAVDLCDMLESELDKHQFAATDKYSLADVVWTVFIGRLFMIKFDSLVTERKNLHAYWQRMTARKSFVEANIWTKMQPKLLIKIMLALLFLR